MKQKSKIALYSIKPIYSNQIISGAKTFELRKMIPASKIDYIMIYSSSPTCKVVGYAEILKIHTGGVTDIWQLVKNHAGITKQDYMTYFKDKTKAYAFELGKIKSFNVPFKLEEINPKLTAPQSFTYIDGELFKKITQRKSNTVKN